MNQQRQNRKGLGFVLLLTLVLGSCAAPIRFQGWTRNLDPEPVPSPSRTSLAKTKDSLKKPSPLRIRAFPTDPSKEKFQLVRINHLQYKYAEKLGIEPLEIRNLALYGFIDYWYGVRYKYGGEDEDGIDCSAFVQRLYAQVFCTDLLRTALQQFRNCRLELNPDSLREGDLVFFRTKGRRISHVGIYLSNGYFVHASYSNGVTISSLRNRYWSRIFAGAGQVGEPGA